MKRILSMLLCVLLLWMLPTVSVSALDNGYTNKLSDLLKETVDKADPDTAIGVSIRFADINASEADRQLLEATGYTRDELRHFALFRQSSIEKHDEIVKGSEVLAGLYAEHNDGILQTLGIENIRFRSLKTAYAIATVPCGQIPLIAQSKSVLSLCLAPAVEADEGKPCHYADRFLGYLAEEYPDCDIEETFAYDELYEHRAENGEPDWVLIYADAPEPPAPWIFSTVICNRVFIKDGWDEPFNTDYGIYDVKNDRFIDVNNENMNSRDFDPRKYPELVKIFDEYAVQVKGGNINRLLGDLDGDDVISIIDATIIQRCDVNMRGYPEDDGPITLDSYAKTSPGYYSDFNRDGERDILDATCIQRYLADLPYSVGR